MKKVCSFPECDCNTENNGHHSCRAPSLNKLASDRFDEGHRTTRCPKIGAQQWTCYKDECTCHRVEYARNRPEKPVDALKCPGCGRSSGLVDCPCYYGL